MLNPNTVLPILPKTKALLSQHNNSELFSSFRDIPFWCENNDLTIPRRSHCCLNHWIGLPKKRHLVRIDIVDGKEVPIFVSQLHPILPYEYGEYQDPLSDEEKKLLGIFQLLEQKMFLWVKKATGLGITEIVLRYIVWKCVKDSSWSGYQVVIVTGARQEIGIGLIRRIREYFAPEIKFSQKETTVDLNGVHIEAYPSNHTDTFRGLPKVCFIFVDEGDFFSPKEQKLVRDVVERYIGKTPPQIIWVSTPNLPEGLFDQMEREEPSLYFKVFLHYKVGEGTIYWTFELSIAKKSRSFPREYELVYGVGLGNIFPEDFILKCIQEYDLHRLSEDGVIGVDPAYGSSKFAIVIGERRSDGKIYILYCQQIERASPTAMVNKLKSLYHEYRFPILVDGSDSGLITDLRLNSCRVEGVNFNQELDDMVMKASNAVIFDEVRFHPSITRELTHQLIAVTTDKKGHPDKKKLSFDLGDGYLLTVRKFRMGGASGVKMRSS